MKRENEVHQQRLFGQDLPISKSSLRNTSKCCPKQMVIREAQKALPIKNLEIESEMNQLDRRLVSFILDKSGLIPFAPFALGPVPGQLITTAEHL
jgi:hypothetical protein